MARARNIKPSLFKNELLGVLDPLITILFASLWCLADREGRLEDRPLRIKAETFPYREGLDVNGYLTVLEQHGFIQRFEVDGARYIQVTKFKEHQSPHNTEKASAIPKAPVKSDSCLVTVKPPLSDGEKTEALPPDLLIPDSLIPDSLFTDSVTPTLASLTAAEPEILKAEKPDTAHQAACKAVWQMYSTAYLHRYQTQPVRNAKVNSQVKQLVQRLGAEAPDVAAFYVTHNKAFYVSSTHALDPLLKDCEALRTQWATGNRVTTAKANEVDRLQNQGDGWHQLKQEAREKEFRNVQ